MSEMIIYKAFEFDAAHCLTQVPPGHKCGTLHGHTFKVIVYLKGEVDPERGWVLDFSGIKTVVDPVLEMLDHTVLNEIGELGNPTSENLCLWLWKKLKPEIELLWQIEVKENENSGCLYQGG
jgi:6-pyruvoyltetrahydropterin/6-carboxytetrahydropterin synthase